MITEFNVVSQTGTLEGKKDLKKSEGNWNKGWTSIEIVYPHWLKYSILMSDSNNGGNWAMNVWAVSCIILFTLFCLSKTTLQ